MRTFVAGRETFVYRGSREINLSTGATFGQAAPSFRRFQETRKLHAHDGRCFRSPRTAVSFRCYRVEAALRTREKRKQRNTKKRQGGTRAEANLKQKVSECFLQRFGGRLLACSAPHTFPPPPHLRPVLYLPPPHFSRCD